MTSDNQITFNAAGHCFNLSGHCTYTKADGTPCPVRWMNIRHCDTSHIGEANVAHVGMVNAAEIGTIVTRKALEDRLFELAITGRREVVVEETGDVWM